MKFYDALQLDPGALKEKISSAESKEEKHYFIKALIVRDILLVIFSMVFISTLSALFGSENSAMAVVIFCALLSIRFVDFGYKVSDSILALGIVFFILLVSPLLMQNVHPVFGFFINFISLLLILMMTCEKPEMGNGGLFVFGYIFLSGSQISFPIFVQRAEMALIGFILCGLILYSKHHHKHKNRTMRHVFRDFDIHNEKCQWQIQIATAISLLFFIGSFLNIHKFIWIGFACSSLLSSYPINLQDRLWNRALGAVIGSFMFGIVCYLTPPSMTFLFGPLSGLCLGFCSSYRYKTIFNCFGALLMAASIYGIHGAIMLRIANNLIGLLFGYAFFHAFQILFVRLWLKRKERRNKN